MCFFTCLPRPPTLSQRHMDLHVCHTRDPIIYSEFHRNLFRGFGAPGGQNLAFPITLASRFYNSLYYRTSRDIYDVPAGPFRYAAYALSPFSRQVRADARQSASVYNSYNTSLDEQVLFHRNSP